MRLIDADKLKKALSEPLYRSTIKDFGEVIEYTHIMNTIDNAPTVEPEKVLVANVTFDEDKLKEIVKTEVIEKIKSGELVLKTEERPQGECKDCETCEDKAKQYSLGFQDGYLLSGFQLTELRRWLIAQGYSEGTVDDKIEDFSRFVKRVREDEG